MNVKKMFASLTGVLMLAQLAPVAVLGAASYGAELEGAYKYAFEKGITTMASIDSANMYGELTRGQLAKMISNWAEAELGQKADATKVCSFTDESKAEGDLAMYVKKACQMGLMGQGIAEFRPNAKVTRGEFGTTLSRALWGDKYNTTANPYYINHLAALKDAGIMKMIETPNQLEIRGYVMLMLQRAVAAKAKANCTDPVIALACQLGGENCPAECKKDENTVVKAGDLAVTAKAAEGRKALIGGVSDLDTLTFKTSEKVEISKITLERYGYSTIDQVESVQLEDEDGNIIADARELNSKGQVSLSIKRDYRAVNGMYNATVVVKTRNLANNGSTLGFKVVAAESTAKNLNLSSYGPYTYDLVNYDGSKVKFSSRNSATKSHNWEANKAFEVAKFRMKSPADATILVKGFTLTDTKNNEIEADKYAKDVKVTVNGKEVKGLKWNVNKDEELVLSFDQVEVAGKETANFVVTMSFSEDFDNFGTDGEVQYSVKNITKFNAIDKKTESRIKEDAGNTLASVTWTTYTFNGGKIKLSGTKLGTVSAAANSNNVLIAQGQITVTEPVRGTVTLANPDKTADGKNFIEEIRLVVNGEDYEVSNNGQNNFVFNGVEIEKSGKFEIRVDLKDSATGTKQFAGSLTSAAFALKYDVSGEVVDPSQIAGSISISNIKAEAPKATLDNKLTKEVELIKGETNRKVIFDGTYTAKRGAVTLKSFKVTSTAALAIAPQPTFYVTINGQEYDAAYNKLEDIDDIKVEAGKSVPVKVEIELVPTNNDQHNTFKLTIDGEDVDNNKAGEADEDTVKVKTVNQGTLEFASATNAKNTILLKSNRTIAEFVVKPSKAGDSEVTLKSMNFDFVGITDADIKVEVDDDTIAVSSTATEYQPDVKVPADGVKVKVSLKSEVATAKEVQLTLADINGNNNVKTVFNRYYVPATVKLTQRNTKSSTYYSVDVEKDGSDVVKNVKLYTYDQAGCTKGAVTDLSKCSPVTSTTLDEALSSRNEDVMTAINDVTAKEITVISYEVGATPDTIILDKAVYADLFKKVDSNNNDLMVFSNN